MNSMRRTKRGVAGPSTPAVSIDLLYRMRRQIVRADTLSEQMERAYELGRYTSLPQLVREAQRLTEDVIR